MNEHDVKRLQLAELHESTGDSKPAEIPLIIRDGNYLYFKHSEEHMEIYLSSSSAYIKTYPNCHQIEIEEYEIDDLIALLQRVKTIMNGGA